MIYSTEAWSKISDKELTRLEQVDFALLRNIVHAHSKCSKAFLLLEFGVITFSHLIMIRRLMYHHHIISRDNKETIKKIYRKQKEDQLKGDWYETLMTDFDFIREENNDERISKIPKEQYRNMIKRKVENEAFHYFLTLKEKSKKKMGHLKYTELAIQPYLINGQFTLNQIKLLFSLRSKCYPAKLNFRKLNRGNLKCVMGCIEDESQSHIFENCEPLRKTLDQHQQNISIEKIYGSVQDQKEAVLIFEQIDKQRRQFINSDILPGGVVARTQA